MRRGGAADFINGSDDCCSDCLFGCCVWVVFLKASFNSVATYTPNINPNADTNANADMNTDTNEEDYDAILKGAGTLGDDVKAKDISALGNGSLLRGERCKI